MIKENKIVEGVIKFNASGSAYIVSDELEKDLFVYKTNTNKSLHLDIVRVEIVERKGGNIEGKVIEVVKRFKEEFAGTLQVTKSHAFLVPDNHKVAVDIFIPKTKLNGGVNGKKAVVKLIGWEDNSKSPRGEVIEILGDAGDNNAVQHAILHEYDLPYKFDDEVIAESEAISGEITAEEIAKRRDMRNVLTFTIDPDTAKDFDDALSVEWVDGNIQVGVHIADVSHYLKEGTVLDQEAFRRGTSVYLVDRCVPMLPERLSNGLCSLNPHEDKLTYSAVFTLDQNGSIIDEWFGKTIIHSDYRFTYEEAQKIIEKPQFGTVDWMKPLGMYREQALEAAVLDLDRYAKKLKKLRSGGDSISFDKREVKFKLDEEAKPIGVEYKVMKDSNKLIEEFMLLANKRVSYYMNKKELPMVQRSHEAPDYEKLKQLANFVLQFGHTLQINNPDTLKKELNTLLKNVKGTPEENVVSSLVVKCMSKAFYSTENIGHYGLGFEDYSHFTSPIRRYPDVLAHRLLTKALEGTFDNHDKIRNDVERQCIHLSERERKSQKAQRASIKYKQAEYMAGNIGKVFTGVITSIMDFGMFVEIKDNSCEGLVRLTAMKGDTYTADLANYEIKGRNTGMRFRVGDEVTVIVSSVDMIKKEVDLSLLM